MAWSEGSEKSSPASTVSLFQFIPCIQIMSNENREAGVERSGTPSCFSHVPLLCGSVWAPSAGPLKASLCNIACGWFQCCLLHLLSSKERCVGLYYLLSFFTELL